MAIATDKPVTQVNVDIPQIKFEFGMLVLGEGKTGVSGEKLACERRRISGRSLP